MFEPTETPDRGTFLNIAALTEGGLIAAAFILGWVAGIDPMADLYWDWADAGLGLLAACPLLLLFSISYRFPIGPLIRIKRILVESLGPSLAACRWYELVLLAAVAGFSEELFFRGLLQPWFGKLGTAAGLIGSNLLFGLAHCVTFTYFLLAGVVGVYLGLLLHATAEPNVLAPMVTHGVYDFVAFLVIVHTVRKNSAAGMEQ